MPSASPHAILIEAVHGGKTYFRLVCRDNHLCNFFDQWSFSLAKTKSYNTVKAYSQAVKRFVNYFLEAEDQLDGQISSYDLRTLLENYESYLAFGGDSDTPLIRSIAQNIPNKGLSGETIAQEIAALNGFLKESENFRVACLQLQEAGHISPSNLPSETVIDGFEKFSPSHAVKTAVRESSWFAGCLQGGMKTIKKAHLKPKSKAKEIIVADQFGGDDKTFPFDLASNLIRSAPNLRDKLLWSLIAASGIRISEATTMFESDVAIETRSKHQRQSGDHRVVSKKVFVVDPLTRKSELIKYLSESEINRLPHKGRERPDTFLIEPFASMFWQYLAEYKAEENKKEKRRNIGMRNPFLFKNIKTGEPVVKSYQSLYEQFSKTAEKITGKKYGFHSLRHMYGYYIHNIAPTKDDGFGLSLKETQLLLGHANIKNTQRYARQDMMMLEVTLAALNMEQANDRFFSVDKVRLNFLKSKINEIESRMNDDDQHEMINNDQP